MVDGVHLYVEGGGNDNDTRARLREGLQLFLTELRERARSRRLRWNVTVCGGRDQAYRNFDRALRSQPNVFNVLLVDAEAPVDRRHRGRPWQHLRARDHWRRPATARDEHCHLMVQVMEAWLIADREALEARFGTPFVGRLPARRDVEEIDKESLLRSLDAAFQQLGGRARPGQYEKIEHAARMLEVARPGEVRRVAWHCERFFATIETVLGTPMS